MNLKNAISVVPELKDAATSPDPLLRDTIKFAQMLENNVRNTGVHACGTIICRDDISDWVPVSTADDKETGEKVRCTQYDGHVIEETGLIKMDFLGLKTLSILKEAVENIHETLGIDVDVDMLSITDPATYQLYQDGRTIGTFQFESAGMQKYLRELKPTVFEDLIAMNALYRPGPMDYIPQFINRKQGREPIEYDIPVMEKYLKDTYGITVYQEQVMLLSRLLADFTRGESDALRKAMGKKKKKIVDQMKPKFIEGGERHGYKPEVLEKIWGDWEKFASYAFNKSHATCYSWVAYQTAYLKAHFPAQYMAGNMSRNLGNIKEIQKLMDECKAMGVNTLGPDVNESRLKFSVNSRGDVRFGMGAVKGVGEAAVVEIIRQREQDGPFKNIYDFFERVSMSACNRKSMESLILSGALDCFGLPREAFFTPVGTSNEVWLDVLMRYGTRFQADKEQTTHSLFGDMGMTVEIHHPEPPAERVEWTALERLEKERELVGIYISAHPLDEYSVILKHVCSHHPKDLEDKDALPRTGDFTLGGIVTAVRRGTTKKGKPYGIVKIEDFDGAGELALFGENWLRFQHFCNEGTSIYIRACMQPRKWDQNTFDLTVLDMSLLNDVKDTLVESITIDVPLDRLTVDLVVDLAEMVRESPGKAQLYFNVHSTTDSRRIRLHSRSAHLSVTHNLISYLSDQEGIEFKINA